jgi:hypothetical protein
VAGPFHRRFRIALAAGAVSLAAWAWIPGTSLDRAAFNTVCRAFTNPPYFISGGGSHASPWSLRGFTTGKRVDPEKAPVVISLGDDPNNIFQASPQSPLDLAVVLSNFQRHGVKRPAIAAVLAWDNPDVMSLSSLEAKLGSFESITMAAPLARGAVPELIPAPFRRASISSEKVAGDITALPIVNRLSVSGAILGGENCAAGFQSIDSEKPGGPPALLARWEDRVVFAFPLVAAMQYLTIAPDELEVKLGEWVKLGKNGPTVPIDKFGRLTSPMPRVEPRTTIKAEDLIDAAPGILPDSERAMVVLRDDHSAADSATKSFSNLLTPMLSAITFDGGLGDPVAFRRPPASKEWMFLGVNLLLLAWISGRSRFQQTVGFLTISGLVLIAQWLGAGAANCWLPGIAALGGTLAAGLFARFLPVAAPVVSAPEPPPPVAEPPPKKVRSKKPTPAPEEPPPAVEAPVETPAVKEPRKRAPAAKKTARKSATKSAGTKGKKRKD